MIIRSASAGHRGRTRMLVIILLALILIPANLASAQAADVESDASPLFSRGAWIVFGSKGCDECAWLREEFLPALAKDTELPPLYFADIENERAFDLLVQLEESLDVHGETFPALFAGNLIVYGKAGALEKRSQLRQASAETARLPAPIIGSLEEHRDVLRPLAAYDAPESAMAEENNNIGESEASRWGSDYHNAAILYFATPGCSQCARTETMLHLILRDLPQIRVAKIDQVTPRAMTLQTAVTSRLDVAHASRLNTPMVVSGSTALHGKALTLKNLRELVQSYPRQPFWQTWEEDAELTRAGRQLRGIGQSFSIAAVAAAGLLDGINPCAFAVMVFIVSYLALDKSNSRKRRIMFGLSFCLGVFVCYLLLGLGFSQILKQLQKLSGLRVAVLYTVGGLCVLFAAAAAWDAVQAYRHGAETMRFGMPKRFKKLSHTLIRNEIGGGALLVGTFFLGLAVSSLELVCTGQIYLPILVFINSSAASGRSFMLLLVYNIAFVLPLLAVLFIGIYGTESKPLVAWGRKHAVLIRALIGLLILGFGITLFVLAARSS